mgnify:CR=1 FL=1
MKVGDLVVVKRGVDRHGRQAVLLTHPLPANKLLAEVYWLKTQRRGLIQIRNIERLTFPLQNKS